MIERFSQDVRLAGRALARAPGFTAVVVATLALGIGANTAIFSIADQLLLQRLPVQRPEELVSFENPGAFAGRQEGRFTFSYPMYHDFRDRNSVFAGVIGGYPTALTLTVDGIAERVAGQLVTGNYFDVLGVRPVLGRAIAPEDDRVPGAHPIAMISDGFWERRFGRDPGVLDRRIALNGHPMTIVGIAPPGFHGVVVGESPDVLVPVMMKAQMTPNWDDLEERKSRWLTLLARLGPGMSLAQAEASMNVLYRQINEQEVKDVKGFTPTFHERFVSKRLYLRPAARGTARQQVQYGAPILVLTGMVGLVLLIACANVANLLLARGATRQREVAIRLSLGASRAAIVRQRLIESGLLAVAGGACGLAGAWWSVGALVRALPPQSGAGQTLSATPDVRAVLFALAVSIVTAVLFGLTPALQATRPVLANALKNEATAVAGGGQARFRKTLVAAQVGLSVLLLTGAALFGRSLYNLKAVNPGFDRNRLIGFSVDPSLSGYSRERALQVIESLRQQVAAVPGIVGVSPSVMPLLTDQEWGSTVSVEGYSPKEGEDMNPDINAVGPAYFATLAQPLVTGREFTERDIRGAPKVAIVNEAFARYFFGSANPIGRRIGWRRSNTTDIEIVGLVKDSKTLTLRDKVSRIVYTPYMQEDNIDQMTFYARGQGDPAAIVGNIRDAVRRVDPNLPIFNVKTMTTQIDESLFVERAVAALSVLFGALATVLAAIGLYGVMSFSVARRTREIGIRMALGAERTKVLRMVLGEVGQLVAAGVIVGLPTALAFGRVIRSQLFDISPTDPAAIGAATALLVLVAFAAGYIPARRATRIDPMLALRYE